MGSFLRLCALILALGAGAAPTPAGALPVPPARPVLVRMNGPCPKKCEWIAIQGAIDKTTLAGFEALVATLNGAKPPVFFNSVGGEVGPAVLIGERIRQLGLDTAIAATRIAPPGRGFPASSPSTLPRADVVVSGRGFCSSACTFAFAGGVRRFAPLETSLGLHQMIQPEQDVRQKVAVFQRENVTVGGKVVGQAPRLVGQEIVLRHLPRQAPPESVYAAVGAYFAKMGVDAGKAVALMRKMTPDKMDWLTPEEMLQTRLVTERRRADALLDF